MVNIIAPSRTCIFAFVISMSGCSALPPAPDWVEGKSQYYTSNKYLLGLGTGRNSTVAEDNASRKITQHFKSVATSKALTNQTNIIFNQIEFEQPWLNSNTDQYHVLAFISRDKAASFVLNKMLALDELTYQFFEQAKSTTDLLEQTSYINSAVNSQSRRVKLKPLLKILNSENDIPSSYNISRLTKIRNQLQARINLQVKITQNKPGDIDIDTIIKNSLDTAGFIRNDKTKSKNQLLVELKINTSPISQTTGDFFMQGELIASLRHQGDTDIRGQHQWNFSLTAKSHDLLLQKSRDDLTKQLNTNLKQVIMDMMVIEYQNEENIPSQDYVDVDMPEFNSPDNDSPTQSGTTKTNVKTKVVKIPAVSTVPAKIEASSSTQPNTQSSGNDTTKKTIANDSETKPTVVENSSIDTPGNTSVMDTDDPISTLPALAN